MVRMTPISYSDRMRNFLSRRLDAAMEDYQLAYQFAYVVLADRDDENAHNFYDIVLTEDKRPAITYTTLKRLAGDDLANAYERNTRRIAGKPGKVMQRVTGIKDGRVLDVFVNALAANLAPPPEGVFEIAEGKDITYWYANTHYCACNGYKGKGPWRSCMAYPHLGARGQFLVYEESAKLLTRLCETCGMLKGRAILWEDNDGDKWIDRIYADTTVAEQMQEWAIENNYFNIYDGYQKGKQKNFQIDVSAQGISNIPYFDTLRTTCTTCNRIGNYRSQECRYHTCKPHGKTFDIKPATRIAESEPEPLMCNVCSRDLNEWGECLYYGQCDGCNEYACLFAGCPNQCYECEECGTWCRVDEGCPNQKYCETHEENYCEDTCPRAEHCRECGWDYCDQSDLHYHLQCEYHGEWYCTMNGGTCPEAVTCEDCNETIECGEDNELSEYIPASRYPISWLLCHECHGQRWEDLIAGLMAGMIVPAATRMLPMIIQADTRLATRDETYTERMKEIERMAMAFAYAGTEGR